MIDAKVIEALNSRRLSPENEALAKLYLKVKKAISHYEHLDARILADSEESSDDE